MHMNKPKSTKILKLWLIPGLIGGAALSVNAAVQQGMSEIGFSGSYQNNSVDFDLGKDSDIQIDGDSDTLSLTGSYGYFFTDAWQGTIFATYQQQDFGDGHTDTLYVGGAVDYHFNTDSNFVPYVGVGAAYGSIDAGELDEELGDFTEDDVVVQARVGLKQFVAENIAVRYQIEWNQGENTESLGASLGLSTFF